MIKLHKLFASCLGIGLIKGGGTLTAAVVCALWYFFQTDSGAENILVIITFAITAMGIWSAHRVEKDWGKDSSRVVIDEAAGMCISLLLIPVTTVHVLMALGLFRFFDILKPLFIRKTEVLPGGWGVMMDDVLAGVYSNLVLQLLIYTLHV
ncbi:phosphatidylglycerophosphatase A family protein [Sediminibacterium soli]|uniref:phosphatidylglycerophosphatase A family protein n=1 Tax=Sediminibacterium soli TaxID=2698829 RepID=UPI00137B232A|nr:phosphatidylglycerophosphatase A [Sediminibacterium soli]NCI45168.1 phosphatidylglycerophosphatase A [Sediminibacterium soli]